MSSKKTSKPGAAFGIDADPDEFDIEEWLSGASLPARTVRVFQKAGLRAEYDRLEQRFLDLQMQLNEDFEAKGGVEDTLAELGPLGEQYEVALEMRRVWEELRDGELWIKVRACTGDEIAKIVDKLDDEEARVLESVRIGGTVHGKPLSATGWKKLRNAIGERQFRDVVATTMEVNGYSTSFQVMPDFLAGASAALKTKES